MLSIITPTFRRPMQLKETLEHLAAQRDIIDFEVLLYISDPKDTDTPMIASMFDFVKVRHALVNQGAIKNYIAAFQTPTREFKTFLADDDRLDLKKVSERIEVMKSDNIDVLFSPWIDRNGKKFYECAPGIYTGINKSLFYDLIAQRQMPEIFIARGNIPITYTDTVHGGFRLIGDTLTKGGKICLHNRPFYTFGPALAESAGVDYAMNHWDHIRGGYEYLLGLSSLSRVARADIAGRLDVIMRERYLVAARLRQARGLDASDLIIRAKALGE